MKELLLVGKCRGYRCQSSMETSPWLTRQKCPLSEFDGFRWPGRWSVASWLGRRCGNSCFRNNSQAYYVAFLRVPGHCIHCCNGVWCGHPGFTSVRRRIPIHEIRMQTASNDHDRGCISDRAKPDPEFDSHHSRKPHTRQSIPRAL